MSSPSQDPPSAQNSQTTEFLADFSEEDLRTLYSAGEAQHFAAGETAVTEGDQDTPVYIVLEGQAGVSVPSEGGLVSVATLLPGSIFGELSFFDHMPRSARVSALTDCTVLKVSEDSFRSLLDRDARVALAFVQELSKVLSLRLRQMNRLVQTMSKS